MSELIVRNPSNALQVARVAPGSPAEAAGIQPGDLVREVNGRPILDILDWRFHTAEPRLKILLERQGQRHVAALRRPDGQDPGIEFTSDLGDRIHTCSNKCVFCFIHQMPRKMRRSLYLMDDDFRLSFMHGNYVTLTNVSEEEFRRIIGQRLSPLYVSVHATDPWKRAQLLGRKEPQPILPRLRALAEHRIDVHAQIVLCPGLNDGEVLERTLEELADEHPARSGRRAGVRSVAVVPVGLTKFRERLPRLRSADRDYAAAMVDHVRRRSLKFRRELGTRFVWLSDEWHFLAGRPVPGMAHYEDFPQLEDGIGTVRLFLDEARRLERRLPAHAPRPVSATLVTAELPGPILQQFAGRLNRIRGVDVNVCVVRNAFFGGGINIAGLLTAADILEQLAGFPLRESLVLPRICLRDGQLFLDDWTVEEASREVGRPILVSETSPRGLCALLGLLPPARPRRPLPERWVIEDPAGPSR